MQPALKKRVASFFLSMGKWVMAGGPVVSDEVLLDRREQCRRCPNWNAPAARCEVCGCGEIKHLLATEQCPDDPPRWLRQKYVPRPP